ncbi:hypothetical protein [Inquilinus sp. OTU3971]|uniref:hypothetical protein n=1 Tax=Inquilinus sp. OTU3971 TaxID=3043855 RepID=UPI00313AB7FC
MAAARVDRRLAAMLIADVVGYSALMERDEDGTLALLKACRKEIIEPLIAEYQGRIVKLMGDGVLGIVEIHLEWMTAAARWMKAEKL